MYKLRVYEKVYKFTNNRLCDTVINGNIYGLGTKANQTIFM